MRAEIQKGTGIEGLVRGNVVEERRTIDTEDSSLKQALNNFDNDWIDASQLNHSVWPPPYGKTDIVLTPNDISTFWSTILTSYDPNSRRLLDMGRQIKSNYISALIQNSYNAGNNGFLLHTNAPDTECPGFSLHVEGIKEKPMEIRLTGDTNEISLSTKYAKMEIEGDAGLLLVHDSIITIMGDVFIGTGDGTGYGVSSVEGNIFKSPNYETIKKISGKFPLRNKLVHILPDGTDKRIYMTTELARNYLRTFADWMEDEKR